MILTQIGLGKSMEFIYILGKYPSSMKEIDKQYHIPRDAWNFKSGEVRYIGVDMNPNSVQFAMDKIKHHGAEFYNFAIVEDSFGSEYLTHDGWSCEYKKIGYPPRNEEYTVRALSLKQLFDLTAYPDILILDIESMEYRVLSTYDWHHKPRYLKVEMHTIENANRLIPIIISQGYSLLTYVETNDGKTSDAQFLRNDLINEERQRFVHS